MITSSVIAICAILFIIPIILAFRLIIRYISKQDSDSLFGDNHDVEDSYDIIDDMKNTKLFNGEDGILFK